ncbi:MAG: NINE protein [Synechococcales cyanobacterium T60_A2020_003]|nr:NINE protein [Synechococcales cyanobacterium T60_A2020_003]
MLSQPKRRPIAIGLAIASTVLPLSGLHKFYLGQPIWGIVYLLLSWTPIPKIASLMEAVWYFLQTATEFHSRFNALELSAPLTSVSSANAVQAIADALRQLESLRQEGLISEYEFEQKRRQLLKSTP